MRDDDGSAQTPCSATATGAGALSVSVTVIYGNNTNAGTATADATYAGDGNHNGSTAMQRTFAIDKANSTTAITCPVSVTYDGSAQTPCSATATGAGGLSVSVAVVYGNNTNAGTATADASFPGDGNHNGSTATQQTFAIERASSTTAISCPTNVTYNGSAQTPCSATATGAGGLNVAVTIVYGNNTNAGTATADASYAGDANHTSSTAAQKTFTIDKATPTATLAVTNSPQTYNGSAQAATLQVSASSVPGSVSDVRYDGSSTAPTAAATYVVTAQFVPTDTANYNTLTGLSAGNFVINKASSATTITCPASVTYDGSPRTPCTATATGVGGLSVTVTVSYGNNTNAGTATADATYAGDGNHNGSMATQQTFAIDKAASAATISCPANVTYTGSAQTPCSATATGAGALNDSLTVVYGNNTNAGTATANATYAGDGNHNGSTATQVTFTIDKASSTTAISCPTTNVTYNGSAQTPCSAAATGAGGLTVSLTVVYSNNTNAGTATADASYAGDPNHNNSAAQKTFTIDKASSTTTVTCPAGVIFSGSAQTPCSATVTGAGGLSLTPTPNYSNNINVGTATASYTFTGDANHTGSSDSKTFTINSWTTQGFYQPVDMAGVVNTVRAGSTVPLKFNLFAGSVEKTNTTDVKMFSAVKVACTALSPIEDAIEEFYTTGGTSLRYDTVARQFVQNWQTSKSGVGSCYKVVMTALDNSTIEAYFKLK